MEAVKDVAAGTLAGAAGTLATAPLDVLRVRLQMAARSMSPLVLLRSILVADGVRGLIRGVGAPLATAAPSNATIFLVNGIVQRLLAPAAPADPYAIGRHAVLHAASGACAGLVACAFSIPAELVKLQLQAGGGRGGSAVRLAREIARGHGPAMLYRGAAVTVARDVLAFAFYFSVYDATKRVVHRLESRGSGGGTVALASSTPLSVSTGGLALSGGIAGVASWLFTYPIDVVKSWAQAQPLAAEWRPARQLAREAWRRDGAAVFTRGLGTTLVRAFACSAVVFPVFEALMAAMHAVAPRGHQDELHR